MSEYEPLTERVSDERVEEIVRWRNDESTMLAADLRDARATIRTLEAERDRLRAEVARLTGGSACPGECNCDVCPLIGREPCADSAPVVESK